ncbi:helix-turn-helix domain-containing protein [Lacipirellula parvula]|uniref:helix-turn-helix transcriptional regulator n=1 Tax=Lacipirellula parvula TaxID=2650471 RepID=UPI0012609846
MLKRNPEPEPPILVTRREAARLLAVTERHLQNLDRAGVFKPVRLGTAVRYRRCDIEATIAKLAEGGDQ